MHKMPWSASVKVSIFGVHSWFVLCNMQLVFSVGAILKTAVGDDPEALFRSFLLVRFGRASLLMNLAVHAAVLAGINVLSVDAVRTHYGIVRHMLAL